MMSLVTGFAEEMDLRTILIGTFPISLKFSTISLTLPGFFNLKEMEKSLVEVEKEHSPAHEKHSQRVITLIPLKEARPKMCYWKNLLWK